MPKFRILLKDVGAEVITADGWKIKDDWVTFVAAGAAGKAAADPIEQSKLIAAAVKLSELAAIIKVED